MARILMDRVVFIYPDTIRTVVCDTCCTPVAEDNGMVLSEVVVNMAIANHIDHPRNDITIGRKHELETYNHRTNLMTWGIVLKGDQIL